MNVEFSDDELVEALAAVVGMMADEAGLSDKDRAMLKRWRSTRMKLGTDDMDDFVRKANDDFSQTVARRERSQLRKPDWVE